MAAAAPVHLLSSLLRLSRDLSQNLIFPSVARKSNLLSLLFEDLLRNPSSHPLPRSALLCFAEILVVLQKLKALVGDCSTRSRIRLLLEADPVSAELHELVSDLSTLLGILPDLDLSDDVNDLIALLRRHCRKSSPDVDPADESLRWEILSLIRDVENEIVPERSRLERIFDRLGLEDSRSCLDEIESLEREIGDRVTEKWLPAMIASVGLVRYAKCVLFGASTPRQESSGNKFDFVADVAVPADFRCPISLELMRDPVVAATGQTYDRESIEKWIASGHATCPKTGTALAHRNLVPNKALKNLISVWCKEENIPFDVTESTAETTCVTVNKAASEAARLTASFLVEALAAAAGTDAANRIVHELRLLARSGSDIRIFIGDAGGIPLLVPLLSSADSDLQLNAITALLNLSILDANKRRMMYATEAIGGILHVMSSANTCQARENAAATIFSLSSVHCYRRHLGRDIRIIEILVRLVKSGPLSTKKDALLALASFAADRECIRRLADCHVIDAAAECIETAEEAVAVIAALAKRGAAVELAEQEGIVTKLVRVLKNGSDSARENAASALVYMCRKSGDDCVISEMVGVSGIEWVIWEMMGSGTERGRRKAAALGRICRRHAVAAEAARLAERYADVNLTLSAITMATAQ